MHSSEVNKQIKSDYDSFVNSPYNKSVPENIIDLFEKALMIVPPQAHGVHFTKVKSIISKEIDQLSVSDINDIIKLIWNTPLQAFHDSLFDAIPEQIKLEKFVLKFNMNVEDFQKNLEDKRKRLEQLSGGILNGSFKSINNGGY
jgi:hypothetical protein